MGPLETLLDIQAHDTAAEQLRHRRAAIPERADYETKRRSLDALDSKVAESEGARDATAREERKFADEAAVLSARVQQDEAKLYSGEIASPRELQALQADIDQLRRHQRAIEDRELETMETREQFERELADLGTQRRGIDEELQAISDVIGEQEATFDEALAVEQRERDGLAARLDAALLESYERARATGGTGAARLVGDTCQGCHLSLPATEVARVRKQAAGGVSHCDNCGCILVPS